MVRRLLNRLIGRTDPEVDAVNAFVDGDASADELRLIEEMMRRDPALERDLTTQMALRDVLGRVEKIETTRSFTVTPEMIASAERKDSGIARLTELFAPQRKLALAPVIVAGIAALSVALLTLGDFTGIVEQSGRTESFATTVAADSGAIESGFPEMALVGDDSGAPAVEVAPDTSEAPLTALATAEPGVTSARSAEAEGRENTFALESAIAPPAADVAESGADASPDLSASAAEQSGVETLERSAQVEPSEDEIAAERSISGAADAAAPLDGSEVDAGEDADLTKKSIEFADSDGLAFESTPESDGISLPLWQLQVTLAALALAAIGAWAGLRRVRGG